MKTAVITGSSRGIGFGLAKELRSRGFDVVVSGRGESSVTDAAKRLEESTDSGKVVPVACDVADPAAVQRLWDVAATELGSVDLWINNAGVARTVHPVVDLRPEWIVEMVTSNMVGTILGSRVAVRGMTSQGHGQLVNILGGGSDGKIRPGMTVYGSTKRGLRAFTDALVRETSGGPVRIASVSPGVVVTDGMIREAHELGPEGFARVRKAMNILADPVDDAVPPIVDMILANPKHGATLKRVGSFELGMRFAKGGKGRDVFAGTGV
ncbi:SDR family NAD(P)-dependent oxidoreductase [Mumia quercus]|uniref:SDR family NAD(P)-dependent oxidoreductase n=1 Tax=Mumia quercus TaxID=2976125 RepID=UPI0021D1D9F4|nr:SDR family oxidoreductase [Mumia quercus]